MRSVPIRTSKPPIVLRLLASAILLTTVCQAQLESLMTRPQRGFLPNAAQFISEFDSVNVTNGNVNLRIPLASLPPGRAGMGFQMELVYNSAIWDIQMGSRQSPLGHTVLTQELAASQTGGWHYNFENLGLEIETRANPNPGSNTWNCASYGLAGIRVYRLRVALPDGSQHILHLRGYGTQIDSYATDGYYAFLPDGRRSECAKASTSYPADITGLLTYFTTDGSYLKLEIQADGTPWWNKDWTLYFPDGRRMTGHGPTADRIFDSNGNKIEFRRLCHDAECTDPYMAITDDFEREIIINWDGPSSLGTSYQHTMAIAGRQWAVNWGNALLDTVTGTPQRAPYTCGAEETTCPVPLAVRGVLNITLPSTPSTTYSFGYSDQQDLGYGELDHVTTPYGAEITYRYAQEGLVKRLDTLLRNPVKTKTVMHDGIPDLWTYHIAETLSTVSTITQPDGGTTKYEFYDPTILSDWRRGLVWKTTDPNGNVIERVWSQNRAVGVGDPDPNNPFLSSQTSTFAGTSPKSAVTSYTYDKNGNLLSQTDYDWTQAGTTVLRNTALTYFVSVPGSADQSDQIDAYWRPHNPAHWPTAGQARRLNAVLRREVSGLTGLPSQQAVASVSEYEYDNAYANGNPKKEKRWDSIKLASPPGPSGLNNDNSVVSSRDYDQYGNVIAIHPPEVGTTTILYEPVCSGAAGLYPSRIQRSSGAEQRTRSFTWNCDYGTVATETDVENGITTSYHYDALDRVTDVTEGGLRIRTWTYNDSTRTITTNADLTVVGGGASNGELGSVTHYDQLGRVRLIRTVDGTPLGAGESDGIKTQTVYRTWSGGSLQAVSNPYRTAPTGWTCTQWDTSGRVHLSGTSAGASAPSTCENISSKTTVDYNADLTTVTGPNGRHRENRRDGLGRLTAVTEHPDTDHPNLTTSYGYNPLDEITDVLQDGQNRKFVYDSIGRLGRADNPETTTQASAGNGSISYTYYDHGGLKTKADGRLTITYGYDSLQRLRTKSYSDGTPTVTYDYYLSGSGAPQIGRLKSVTTSDAAMSYTYNALGQVTSNTQTIAGAPQSYTFQYTRLLNGDLKTMRYPSGRLITYAPDNAGRILQVTPENGVRYLRIESSQYEAQGAIGTMQLGNGLYETRTYDAWLRATGIKLGLAPQGEERLGLTLTYSDTVNLSTQQIRADGLTLNQGYDYDGVNRLASASEAGWSRGFKYDGRGNMWVTTATGVPSSSFTAGGAGAYNQHNQLTTMGATYDASGNQAGIGAFSFHYDGENRMKDSALSGATTYYTYDGEGRRVKKVDAQQKTTYYVYDADGQLAAEYGDDLGPVGRLYLTTDHLDSVRLTTDAAGAMKGRCDYIPFGEEIPVGISGRTSGWNCDMGMRQRFTGQYRDTETASSAMPSGLDYFGARYFSGAQGRFTSPDEPLYDQHLGDPQSWNLYSYVRNNPLKFTDPSGNDCIYKNTFDEKAGTVVVETGSCSQQGGTYVAGTIGSITYDTNSNSLDYGYTAYKGGTASVGSTALSNPDLGLAALQRGALLAGTVAEPLLEATLAFISGPGMSMLSAVPEVTIGGAAVIGKLPDLRQPMPGENVLDLPNQGSPKANWIQNSGKLRQAMAEGRPIRDASGEPLVNGQPGNNTGFLRAERALLRDRGWVYRDGYWYPPKR